MARFRYTKEQVDYVRSIAKGRYNDEITEMFNKKFNTNKTVKQISSMKKNFGITSGELRKRRSNKRRLFIEEQERFIRENVKGRYNDELTELLNEKFNTKFTVEQVKGFKNRNKISSGITCRFEKGHKPWNKNLKGLDIGGKETRFKKGHQPLNYRPVGSERTIKDGYIEIKVADPNVWKLKHNVIWEEAYGKIPDGHVLVFLDSNRLNVTLENLALISRAELARMNQNNLFSEDPELTLAGITLVRLNKKIYDASLLGDNKESLDKYKKLAVRNGISEQTFTARLRRGWRLDDALYKPLHYKPATRERRVD